MRRLGLTALLLIGPGASAATEPRVTVTTDSLAYCRELGARLALAPNAGEEPALSLGREGGRLCEGGHLRGGIAGLRRALRAARGER